MNLIELIFKQMRQRLLSTILTCLSVALGMAMATGIGVVAREGQKVFAQTDYGYDLIVGPKGSALSLVLNTVYHVTGSAGVIPYRIYEDLAGGEFRPDGSKNPFHGLIRWAVPLAVGDSYRGRPIVGTTPQFFGMDNAGNPLPDDKVLRYRDGGSDGGRYTFAAGRPFAANRFEAVIGSEVAQRTGLGIGKIFQATHGFPKPEDEPDIHPEKWTIVGVLNETHTASDRCLFIPLMSFYAISEHEEGLKAIAKLQGATEPATAPAPATTAATTSTATTSAPADEDEKPYDMNPDGSFTLKLPKDEWEISAILIRSASAQTMIDLPSRLRNMNESAGGGSMAVQPAVEMRTFLQDFLPGTTRMLLLISALVTIVAGVSILVSIYNSVTARNREIAILRALGATRARILAVVSLEALLIGLIGGVLGLLGGHAVAFAGSVFLQGIMGTGIAWWQVSTVELLFLPAVVIVAFLAGLVPATKAYSISVAEHLA